MGTLAAFRAQGTRLRVKPGGVAVGEARLPGVRPKSPAGVVGTRPGDVLYMVTLHALSHDLAQQPRAFRTLSDLTGTATVSQGYCPHLEHKEAKAGRGTCSWFLWQ